jgi:hypothetical protein
MIATPARAWRRIVRTAILWSTGLIAGMIIGGLIGNTLQSGITEMPASSGQSPGPQYSSVLAFGRPNGVEIGDRGLLSLRPVPDVSHAPPVPTRQEGRRWSARFTPLQLSQP